jgi:signal transduction histidine kinase
LAHEFQTPLATILAAAGGLREAGPLSLVQLQMTDTVENEAAWLGSLTSRLLRTVRLDNEEIRPRIELIDITSLVSHIVDRHSNRSLERHVLFANRLEGVEVPADPELLRLTLNQLIENACKYSRPGSTVTVETKRQGSLVAVDVANDGSWIPLNERSRIFERFYRGAEARRSTSGSGLGLHVARKIAVAHGGLLDLVVGEEEDDRVTFSLKIPRMRDEPRHAFATK